MKKYGFNINFKMTPQEIRELGKAYLGSGQYEAIEVTYYENMMNTDTTEYNQAISEIIQLYHPQVLVHISAFNLAEENSTIRKAIVEEIKNCINYTVHLGGREVVIHSGSKDAALHVPIVHEKGARSTQEENYQKAWGLSVEMMREACDLAKEQGVQLYTENLNGDQITVTSEVLRKYIEEIDRDNLKIVFDVGHCHHMGYDIVSEVKIAGDLLAHLHIHDNHGYKETGFLDEHAPLGEGTIDFKKFTDALKEVHYDGLYMMELFYCNIENLKTCREVLESSLEND